MCVWFISFRCSSPYYRRPRTDVAVLCWRETLSVLNLSDVIHTDIGKRWEQCNFRQTRNKRKNTFFFFVKNIRYGWSEPADVLPMTKRQSAQWWAGGKFVKEIVSFQASKIETLYWLFRLFSVIKGRIALEKFVPPASTINFIKKKFWIASAKGLLQC